MRRRKTRVLFMRADQILYDLLQDEARQRHWPLSAVMRDIIMDHFLRQAVRRLSQNETDTVKP